MNFGKMHAAAAWVVGLGLASCVWGADTYRFASDQTTYTTAPGGSVDVILYLAEQRAPGDSSLLADEQGLFSSGLQVVRDGGTSDPALILALSPDAGFDGTVQTTIAADIATLYADHNSGFGPGALPDSQGLVPLAVLHLTTGSSAGQTTSFQISDDSPDTSNTVTYAGTALDSDPFGISAGSFSVTTIESSPEPASLAAVGLSMTAMLLSRRRTPRAAGNPG